MHTAVVDDPQTMYARLGGFAVVRKLVIDFYERVLDSDVVGHHFDNIDMARLIDHQTRFLSGVLGGPATIEPARIERAHCHLNITHAEFDEIGQLLNETLSTAGVGCADRNSLLAAVETFRCKIVAPGDRS